MNYITAIHLFAILFSEKAIADGLDVLVGTPGRLLDHLEKGNLDLGKLKHIVLDEVDQMLDMGFADTVESIIKSAYERGEFSNFFSSN